MTKFGVSGDVYLTKHGHKRCMRHLKFKHSLKDIPLQATFMSSFSDLDLTNEEKTKLTQDYRKEMRAYQHVDQKKVNEGKKELISILKKLRDEKMKVLNAKALDPVSKKFDLNCLRVLASRYLFRNGKNEITETPTQMFERVAILVGVGDILYDSQVFDKAGNLSQNTDEATAYIAKLDSFDYKFKIGEYFLNKYHFRSLINHYVTLANKGQMKVSFKELLTLLAAKKFDSYSDRITEYLEMMTSQDFLPNSPTM